MEQTPRMTHIGIKSNNFQLIPLTIAMICIKSSNDQIIEGTIGLFYRFLYESFVSENK